MTDWSNAVADLQEACLDIFGVPVHYIPCVNKRPGLGGQAIEVTGIFDDNRETVTVAGGMDAVVPRPVVELRLSDLGIDPMEGDEVQVEGVSYRILDVQPDGHGAVVLVLHRNQDPFA